VTGARQLKVRLRYGVAASELGLLSVAADLFRAVSRDAPPGGALAAAAAAREAETAARVSALAAGSGVDVEVHRLRAALGTARAAEVCDEVDAKCSTAAGRSRLLAQGFLESSDPEVMAEGVGKGGGGGEGGGGEGVANGERLRQRAYQRAMLYQVKKQLQRATSATGRSSEQSGAGDGTTGGSYRCVPPSAIAQRSLPGIRLTDAHMAALVRDRFVVVDDVLPEIVVTRARGDVHEMLHTRHVLRTEYALTPAPCTPLDMSVCASRRADACARP
jgi:hypothetical protein